MSKKSPDLATLDEAKELLDLDDDGLAAAVIDGTLRRVNVSVSGEFVLGADIDKTLDGKDPRKLAATMPRL